MHLLVILVIVLIIFGPGKLPELGNSLSKAIRGFKKAMDDGGREVEAHSEANKVGNKKE
ncbi:MAG TPA: twin-arginine translocase TatA/TatE family subunit [Syntrophobacteria bacterium]|nr:twin-arginine translocase TatA/TatE family subunit [Syntrophobacteria bacterium]